MGDIADDMRNEYENRLFQYGTAFCAIHHQTYIDDEYGCRQCEVAREEQPLFKPAPVQKPHVLRPYQKKALAYTIRAKHPALLLGMRLGKNAVTIRRCRAYSNCKLFLIVCPNPAFASWKRELARENAGHVFELTGTRAQRQGALEAALEHASHTSTWCIINREGWRYLPEIKDTPWDVLIIDEKIISDPSAKITQFFLKNFRNVKHRWQLSGKLAPESELQWITPLWFLDPKIWGQRPPWTNRLYFQLRDKYFQPFGYEWHVKKDMRKEWEGIIAKNCFILDQRDVKLGGITIHEQRTVRFPKNLRDAYTALEKSFILKIDDREIARTIYAPGKHILFRRMCGGFLPGVEWKSKLEELIDLLCGELRGEPVIICAMFTEEIDEIHLALSKRGRVVRVDGSVKGPARIVAENAFQSGKADWFLCHPACYQYGAELHRANTMIFYSSPESLDMREQMEKRFVDLKKTGNLLVIDLIVEDTIEEDILLSLLLKEGSEDRTRRIVKRMQHHAQR